MSNYTSVYLGRLEIERKRRKRAAKVAQVLYFVGAGLVAAAAGIAFGAATGLAFVGVFVLAAAGLYAASA